MPNIILIIGSRGTLGQALTEESSRAAYEVVAWGRENGDVTAKDLESNIVALRPNIIINATGYNAVDKAETGESAKLQAFELNAHVPEKLAKIASRLGSIFVHYSTDYVFDGAQQLGYREDNRPRPVSIYGQSKYAGEQAVQAVGGKYFIIRLSRLFGRRGASSNSKKSFVDLMLEQKDKEEIEVLSEERSCPTYAPDAARFTRALIESDKPSGIYHGTNVGACTWMEWAREIFGVIGAPVKLTAVPASHFERPAVRPKFSELLNTKMPLQRSWQEALQEYLKTI